MTGRFAVRGRQQRQAPARVDSLPHSFGQAYFEVYRTERVSLTSILFSGDDWRWRFYSAGGIVLVNSEGYRNERDCRAAVSALQNGAGSAKAPK